MTLGHSTSDRTAETFAGHGAPTSRSHRATEPNDHWWNTAAFSPAVAIRASLRRKTGLPANSSAWAVNIMRPLGITRTRLVRAHGSRCRAMPITGSWEETPSNLRRSEEHTSELQSPMY